MKAFIYLSWATARNRLLFQIKRVRTPRYAAALIVGIAYIYSFLLRPGVRGAATTMLVGREMEMISALLVFATVMGAWIFGSDLTALAFSPAEVAMLFSAPLSRRQLLGFKLYRAQIAIVVNALIWVFLLERGAVHLPPLLRAIAIWALFSALNMHRLGAALARASWMEHGASAIRRSAISTAVFVVLVALLAAGLIEHRAELLHADGIGAFFSMLAWVLNQPPASIALYPFHLAVAPTFARTSREWLAEIGPALALVVVHAWWVLRRDTAFEDAAIEASAERARRAQARVARRSSAATAPPRAATSTFQLSARGHPAAAIFWKNMICLRRTAQLRAFIGPTAMALVLGAALNTGKRDAGGFIATSAVILAILLLVFGGRLIRNDLRHDMLHLPLIKSLPMAESQVVLAEVASSALPMAAAQLGLVVIAYAASLIALDEPLSARIRLTIVIAAPFALVALNLALLAIQNGAAVLFPAWMRLGTTVTSGVEALGQNVLGTVANLLVLGVGLIAPAAVGLAFFHLVPDPSVAQLVALVAVGSLILATETYGAVALLGRGLARAEPLPAN